MSCRTQRGAGWLKPAEPPLERAQSWIGGNLTLPESRAAVGGKPLECRLDQRHGAIVVAVDQHHSRLAALAGLGGRGDRRLGVDPRSVVRLRTRPRRVVAQRCVGRGDRALVVAQPRQCQAPAAVCLAARGALPQRLVEVAERQPGCIGDQVRLAAREQSTRGCPGRCSSASV